jgi:hypothetical protein
VSLLSAVGVCGPLLGQVEPGGDGPGQGAFGVVTVDSDLAVAGLAQGARVLAFDANRGLALLGEASVVEDQDGIPLCGQLHQGTDAMVVEVVLVEGDASQQVVQTLLVGAGDDLGDGVAILVLVLSQQSRQVAFQGLPPLGAAEVNVERPQELVQFRQRCRRRMRLSFCCLHTSLYARSRQLTQ